MAFFSIRKGYAVLAGISAIVASVPAQVRYTLTPDPAKGRLNIQMDFKAKAKTTVLKMPNWAPGAYILGELFKNVSEFKVQIDGKDVLTQNQTNAWSFPSQNGKFVTVGYSVPMPIVDGAAHWSGPSTYLYLDARKEEPCTVQFMLPQGWSVATGLEESKKSSSLFSAPTYDVLADCPVTAGSFIVDTYTSRGKHHIITLRNAPKSKVNRENLLKACKFVTDSEADFFGGLPYDKYVWHFSVNDAADGAGGLEHLNSTQIGLASGVGPRAVSVLAHEFFHLWNVKRIRSKVLGPFDYDQLPKTGGLWWLEGVTDYYANLLLTRYGWWQPESLYSYFVRELNNVRQNPARLEISPYQSSYRVGEANNGRGNSNGYKISYYDLGSLCGMLLDIEIRAQSAGKHSLDDVERALWEMCKENQPGFEEDEIRKQCIRFGGPSLGEFYDKVVMTPGELPVEGQLGKVGLRLADVEESYVDNGFTLQANPQDKGASVRNVHGDAAKLLKDGDLLIAFNGVSLEENGPMAIGGAIQKATASIKAGDTLNLTIRRDGQPVVLTVTAFAAKRTIKKIEAIPEATPAQLKLRQDWIYAGKKPLPR